MNGLGSGRYCQRTRAVLNQPHTFLLSGTPTLPDPNWCYRPSASALTGSAQSAIFKWHSQHPKSGRFWGFISAARHNSKPVPLKADLLLELPYTTRPLHSRPSSRPATFTETQQISCFVKPKAVQCPYLNLPFDPLSFTTLTAPNLAALRKWALKARQHTWQDWAVIRDHQPLLLQNQPLWRYHSPSTPAHLEHHVNISHLQ